MGKTIYPPSTGVGKQRIIWLVRCWLINVFCSLWNARIFSPSRFDPDMKVYGKWDVLDCLQPLRLFEIRPHPLFWLIESDSIVMLDILPYDLHPNARIATHMPPISALWTNSSSSPLNLECASCLPSNVDTTHQYDSALTWKCTHKIYTLWL